MHVPVSRKYSNAFLSYSAKTKRDGQTDGRTGGVAISPVPGPTAPAGDKNSGVMLGHYIQSKDNGGTKMSANEDLIIWRYTR